MEGRGKLIQQDVRTCRLLLEQIRSLEISNRNRNSFQVYGSLHFLLIMTLFKHGTHLALSVPVASLLSIYFSQHYEHSKGRMVSFVLLRRVALLITDVSEETGASFIRVTKKIGELGSTQAATSNRRTLRRNIKLQITLLLVHPFLSP
jgi:hypothetical protein